MKKQIFLHIGHGKTGSSAIQSCLAINHELLKQHGYLYAEHRSFRHAKKNEISSGNISPHRDPNWFESQALAYIEANDSYSNYIFSSEAMFMRMESFFKSMTLIPSSFEPHILLALRNPIELLSSHFQQAVKRGGFTGSFLQFVEQKNYRVGQLARASKLIKAFTDHGIKFTLANYSCYRNNITDFFFDAMGISSLVDTSKFRLSVINRSMSYDELNFIILMNRIYGEELGSRLSDALVNHLPNQASDTLPLNEATLHTIHEVNQENADFINLYLEKTTALSFSYTPTVEKDTLNNFSSDQIGIFHRVLKAFFKANMPTLKDKSVDLIKNVALMYETGESISKEQALELMTIVSVFKPENKLISGKIEEWS
ncbi:MAG: hypothetical protein WED33_02900 [Bacteroidia bacterium]